MRMIFRSAVTAMLAALAGVACNGTPFMTSQDAGNDAVVAMPDVAVIADSAVISDSAVTLDSDTIDASMTIDGGNDTIDASMIIDSASDAIDASVVLGDATVIDLFAPLDLVPPEPRSDAFLVSKWGNLVTPLTDQCLNNCIKACNKACDLGCTSTCPTTCAANNDCIFAQDLYGRNDAHIRNGQVKLVTLVPDAGAIASTFAFDGLANTKLKVTTDSPNLRFATTSFTIVGWIQTSAGLEQNIVDYRKATSLTLNGYRLYLNAAGMLVASVKDTTHPTITLEATSKPITADKTFHHVAAVIDRTAQSMTLFVDGAQVAQKPTPMLDVLYDPAESARCNPDPKSTAGYCNFDIGYSEASPAQPFHGLIDEIAVFQGALLPSEITNLAAKNAVATSELYNRRRRTIDVKKDFGAKGDGTTDDTTAIQTAFDRATQEGVSVHFDTGTYIVSNGLELRSAHTYRLRLIGDNAIIRAVASSQWTPSAGDGGMVATKPLLRISGIAYPEVMLQGFTLDAANFAQNGLRTEAGVGGAFQHLNVHNAVSDGLSLNGGGGVSFTVRDVTSTNNGGAGFLFSGDNWLQAEGLQASDNQGSGYIIQNDAGDGGFMWLRDFTSVNNGGHGVLVRSDPIPTIGGPCMGPHANNGAIIANGWIVGNGLDGVRLESYGSVVRDCTIARSLTNPPPSTDNHAVELNKDSLLVQGQSCTIGTDLGKHVEHVGGHRIFGNKFFSPGGDTSYTANLQNNPAPVGAGMNLNTINENIMTLSPAPSPPLPPASVIAAFPKAGETLNVWSYGAIGDGQRDDTAALQQAMAEAAKQQNAKAVYLPRGLYRTSAALVPAVRPKRLWIYGELADVTATGSVSMPAVLDVQNTNVVVQGIGFSGGGVAEHGLRVKNVHAPDGGAGTLLEGIAVGGTISDPVQIEDSSGLVLERIASIPAQPSTTGFRCVNCTDVTFRSALVRQSRADTGFSIEGNGKGVKLIGCDAENVRFNGFQLLQPETTLVSSWSEGNGVPDAGASNAVFSNATSSVIENTMALVGAIGPGWAIHLSGGANGSRVVGCNVGAGSPTQRKVQDDSSSALTNVKKYNAYSFRLSFLPLPSTP